MKLPFWPRLGHRLRLTLVSAATAGLLLAFVFAGVVLVFRSAEMEAMRQILAPALRQSESETREAPDRPDLGEVTQADPAVTVAVFAADGRLIERSGALPLTPDLSPGKRRVGAYDCVVDVGTAGTRRIVAGIPWREHESAVERLAILLAVLWPLLVGCAALATWIASRETFRPLAELTREAEAMTQGDLSRRLTSAGDDEYALFARRLNYFLDLIQESVARQERFVADAAHELRTPLTVLRGRIETTLRYERTNEEYRDALRVAVGEAERLSTLVELLLRSAASPTAPAAPVDLEEAAEKAQARWLDRFTDAGVALRIESEPLAGLMTEAELDVILDNLLSNALRASPPGGRCTVEVRRQASGLAAVIVEDEGSGVPAHLRDKIFDRFTRGEESRNRDLGGFGIGLAVCRRLVEARGGGIRLEEGKEGGARFVVEVPTPGG